MRRSFAIAFSVAHAQHDVLDEMAGEFEQATRPVTAVTAVTDVTDVTDVSDMTEVTDIDDVTDVDDVTGGRQIEHVAGWRLFSPSSPSQPLPPNPLESPSLHPSLHPSRTLSPS